MKANSSFTYLITLICLFCFGCGVKGDPRPPLRPANIGRGKPSYKKVGKELKINLQDTEEEEKEEDENGNDDD